MTKLMLNKSKVIICLMLLGLVLVQSCRKDNINAVNPELENSKQQKISEATILKWLETNPAAKALTLDWKNAKQSVIEGKNVVRIPTLNVDKISALNKTVDLKLNRLAGVDVQTGNKGKIADAPNPTGKNTNYFDQHPPEVFFVQENGKEDLHTFLLNFVPTNPKKEFGQDSLWTGKLYEWNMAGDTLLVQEMNKSKIVKRYGLKMKSPEIKQQGSNLNNGDVVASLNNKKTSGAWADFWNNLGNAIAEIWGEIGDFFGVATYDIWDERYEWDSIDWQAIGSFFDGIFGGGGSGGGGNYSYTGSGFSIYYSYTPGYQSPDGGSSGGSTTWDPYYNSGGGTPHGPNTGTPPLSSSVSYLVAVIGLNGDQLEFLRNHDDIAVELVNYLESGTPEPWEEKLEFAKWAAGYLNENQTYTWNNFSDRFITNTAQYKLDSYIRNKYPKFSSIADGLVFFLGSNPKVVAALTKYSGFSKNKIMELATNGSGPNIKLSNESWTTIANGKFNAKISDNTIFLAEENVAMFENTFLDGRAKYSLAFSLMVTILHETVHYGRFINGMPDPNSTYDFGTKFEELGFGFNVDFKLNQPVIYKMYYLP